MIFLKKFYAEGFKSFANPTTIIFNQNMSAIVGPNGSGKSNIVDALKWTIGEQSIKQLRGSEKSNLIFAGSEKFPEADYALVELTFDNSNRILHKDLDEIKITRKLIRKTGESIYLLNDEPCKLNEIKEIFLDTGLTKGSLGIISQGTVSWFSESKPEDRRKIFEDAAGIGKYTKRKAESLKQLELAEKNLEIISHNVASIQRELSKLKSQSDKLNEYNEYSKKLKELDLSIKAKQFESNLAILETKKTLYSKKDIERNNAKSNLDYYNDLISTKKEKLLEYKQEITKLNAQKDILNTKRNDLNIKSQIRIQQIENDIKSGNIEKQIKALKDIINSNNQIIEASKIQKEETILKLDIANNKKNFLDQEKDNFLKQEKDISNKIAIKENQLQDLKDRATKLDADKAINIILSNKNQFSGIIDTVRNLIKVPSKYETAISTALGNSVKNIISLDEYSAKKAINFLKDNKGGYLTFLPLDKIQEKKISKEILSGISSISGYIGIAAELIKYDESYRQAIYYLLGNIIIANDIESATRIAEITQQRIKVVTLDGDVKNVGGSLSGGFKKESNSIFNIKEKIEELENNLKELISNKKEILLKLNSIELELNDIVYNISNFNQSIERCTNIINEKEENNIINNNYYNELQNANKGQSNIEQTEVETKNIQKELALTDKNLQDVLYDLRKYDSLYDNLNGEILSLEGEVRVNNNLFLTLADEMQVLFEEIQKLENLLSKIESECIGNYKISLELLKQEYLTKDLGMSDNEAIREIAILKNKIQQIGYINENVLVELKEKQEEFDNINVDYEDSLNACEKLRSIIVELDNEAIKNFNNTIKNVNRDLPEIFSEFFGKGSYCEIKLTDPSNVLESGIDIIVQPRGKKIKNLSLLSGGEKTLVALTVLFAILKSSSLPLVVLDEAEAALDELNVEIFAKIIKKYANNTQFLVITHRTGTMKEASNLFGITMQDKGVSIVIKKTFDDYNK